MPLVVIDRALVAQPPVGRVGIEVDVEVPWVVIHVAQRRLLGSSGCASQLRYTTVQQDCWLSNRQPQLPRAIRSYNDGRSVSAMKSRFSLDGRVAVITGG